MLYFLATHPEAEAAVIAEVDAFGRDKPVTFEDLQGFPFITVGPRGGGGGLGGARSRDAAGPLRRRCRPWQGSGGLSPGPAVLLPCIGLP
jgi:hypothetical protein